MSLTRAFLRGMSLTDEQINAIIEEHTSSTDALKEQRDQYKSKADELDAVKKELEDSKNNDWQKRYESEHEAFEAFKNNITTEKTKAEKTAAFKALLTDTGISEKYLETVMKVSNLDDIELNKDGGIRNAEKLAANIKAEYGDFIVVTETQGANVETPPANAATAVTKEAFQKMSYNQRLELFNSAPEVYNALQGNKE